MPSNATKRWRPSRVGGVEDLADQLTWRNALTLAAIETLGLALLFGAYAVVHARSSVLSALLVPPTVSYVLIVANPVARGSRPLRVLAAYAIAGGVGLTCSALPGPNLPAAVLSGFCTLIVMHRTGALHSPAIAVAFIAVLADLSAARALIALPLLLGLCVVVVVLAWATHRILGDATYPTRWW